MINKIILMSDNHAVTYVPLSREVRFNMRLNPWINIRGIQAIINLKTGVVLYKSGDGYAGWTSSSGNVVPGSLVSSADWANPYSVLGPAQVPDPWTNTLTFNSNVTTAGLSADPLQIIYSIPMTDIRTVLIVPTLGTTVSNKVLPVVRGSTDSSVASVKSTMTNPHRITNLPVWVWSIQHNISDGLGSTDSNFNVTSVHRTFDGNPDYFYYGRRYAAEPGSSDWNPSVPFFSYGLRTFATHEKCRGQIVYSRCHQTSESFLT